MKISTAHIEVKDSDLEPLIKHFQRSRSCKCKPLINQLHNIFNTEIEQFISDESRNQSQYGIRELLVSKEHNLLIHINTEETGSLLERHIFIEFRILYQNEHDLEKFYSVLKRFVKEIPILPGTIHEKRTADTFAEDLQTRSPNGKIIEDIKYSTLLTKLGDNQTRETLSQLIKVTEVYGLTIPKTHLYGIFAEDYETVDEHILKMSTDPDFFQNYFSYTCRDCLHTSLLFEDKIKAEEIRPHISSSCPSCGKDRLELTESIKPTKAAIKLNNSGVWLENLVYNILSQIAFETYACRFMENIEFDVIAVYLDDIFLIECKDTSFGQKDLLALSVNAQELRADRIVVITTKPVHENVKKHISKIGSSRKRRDLRTFRVPYVTIIENVSTREEIIEKLIGLFEKQRLDYLDEYFDINIEI